uniref:Uncharacterized protein n=1 Tax=Oryza barthii TaxID=65489 RepID=A0A0D3EM07_9ORYZ
MATCINGGELQVQVVSRRLVQASDESLRPHVLAVSNLDLLPQSIQVSTICIYPNPPTSAGGFHDVVAAYAAGLPSVGESIQKILLPYAGDVALSVQVVSFACGGFTVAWGTNHVVAISAYLWKALAGIVREHDAHCRMGLLRAATRNYVGNVVAYTVAEATMEEIQRKPLAEVASMARRAIAAPAYDEHFQELVDWVEEHKAPAPEQEQQRYVEAATVGLGSPTVSVTAFAPSLAADTDFGYGHAAMALPASSSSGARLCSGFVRIIARPGGDGSCFAGDGERLGRIFKPVTAEYLGLRPASGSSVKRAGMITSKI